MATRARSAGSGDTQEFLALFGPPLLDALVSTDRETRRRAARALQAAADADPSVVGSLTDRLVDRLTRTDQRAAVVRTLATLATDHPERVRTALAQRETARKIRTAVFDADGWSFESGRDGDVDGEWPARSADGGTDAAPSGRTVVDADGPSASDRTAVVRRDADRQTDAASPGTSRDAETAGRRSGPSPDAGSAPDPAAVGRRRRIERAEESRVFRAIALLGAFDDIEVVEPEQAVRYGSALRTRATVDGDEYGVAVRLVDLPESGEPRRTFTAGVAERLAAWHGVAGHDGVLGVHDWGDNPRPWVATPYVDGSLADRGRAATDRGLREAVRLARAVEHCHANGVVHAGIDPRSVVYPDDSLDDLALPRLDNVGLMREVRDHFDPAQYLDPRYAAPEYFDRSYGAVDQATDVYQLGATLYRLFTGRAPFTGSYDDVRAAVLDDRAPAPSAVATLPSALDPVFAKALAARKLTRYETVTAMRADLEAVAAEVS